MKKDITDRTDITRLMELFYDKLLANDKIAYLFTEDANINMKLHLPIIVDFWEMVLFQKGGYQKNVMKIHQDLNSKSPFTKQHFDIWLQNFNQTVDELFEGTHAIIAKQRAQSVATMMQIKMLH